MYRIKQILAITFVTLLTYVDIGLLYNVNHGLHAHIIANNQILIHFHYANSHQNSTTHHSNDCNPGSISLYTTFLTFINNGQSIFIKECFHTIQSKIINIDFAIPTTKQFNNCFLRAPPIC